LNTVAISHLRYIPSVLGAENAVKSAAADMKVAGMLSPSTNVADLAKRAFVRMDGVSDEWLQNLQVEKVAGGQVPPDQDIRLFAELIRSDNEESCCKAKNSLAAKE
jgi:NitT/TauT family transport system substrate-binding protein